MRKLDMAHQLEENRKHWEERLEKAIDAPKRIETVVEVIKLTTPFEVKMTKEDSGFARGVVVEKPETVDKRHAFFENTLKNIKDIAEQISTICGDPALSAKLKLYTRETLGIANLDELSQIDILNADLYGEAVNFLNQETPANLRSELPKVAENLYKSPIIEVVDEVLLEAFHFAVSNEQFTAEILQPMTSNIDKLMTQKLVLKKMADAGNWLLEQAQEYYKEEPPLHAVLTTQAHLGLGD